ncbi:MAG TPA: SDR family oxidoreductase [Gammaproteobacteria bacterium]
MHKKILIVGARGFIGQALLQQLQAAGHRVTACVRDTQRFRRDYPTTPVVQADYTSHTTPQQWLPLLQGFEVVINAVGIIREQDANSFAQIHTHGPIALFDAAVAAGVEKVVQISALGSDAAVLTPFHLSKRAADEHLARTSGDWLILRPSLVYGEGGKSAALFKAVAALPLIPLAGRGGQRVQPVAVEDVARIVLAFIDGEIPARQHVDVVGRQAVTIREMLGHYRHWLGLGRPRFLAVPEWLALWLAHRLGLFGIAAPGAKTLALLRNGSTADTARLIQQTGITPLSLEEGLRRAPAQQPERWHARLYFLHPLLRITLAFMWLWTALVSAGLYPLEESLALLAAVGLTGTLGLAALVSATLLDLLLGLALLLRRRVNMAAWLSLAAITSYSLIITLALPEYWLHPFGPLSKNLPLLVATLILIAMET